MSRIPIDLPPDTYPKKAKVPRRGGSLLVLLLLFASVFAVTYLALAFL